MPCQYAPGVSIGHKDRTLRRIEDDGVNRFGSETPEVQQLAAEFFNLAEKIAYPASHRARRESQSTKSRMVRAFCL